MAERNGKIKRRGKKHKQEGRREREEIAARKKGSGKRAHNRDNRPGGRQRKTKWERKTVGEVSNKVEFVEKSQNEGYSGINSQERKMVPVKSIQNAILSMGGHQSRECYELLCMAIYEASKQQPRQLQMKEIWAAVKKEAHKEKTTAVSKALERAVADLWENGNRDVMGLYQRSWQYDKPYPKEFIRVMAQHLWDGEETKAAVMPDSVR